MNFTSYHWFIVLVTTTLFASSLISTVDSEYDPKCKELVNKKLFIRMISITSGSFALITTQGNIFIGDKAEMFNPKELLFRLNTKSTLVSESFVGFNVDLRKSLPRKNEVEVFMMINMLPHMVVLNRTSVQSKVCIRMYKFGEDKAPPEADCSLPITSRFNMLLNDYSDDNVVVAFNFDNGEFQEQFKLKWNNKNAKFEYISLSVHEKTVHNNRYSPNTAFYTSHSQVALVWEVNTAQIFHIGSKEIGKSPTKINNIIKCEPIIYGAGTGTPPQINQHMNAWTIYRITMILMGIVIIIGLIYFVVKCRQCDQGDKEKMDKRETTKKNKKDKTKINKDKMKQVNMSPTKKSKSPELKNMTSSSPSSDNRTSSSPSEGAKKKRKKITRKTDTLGSTENNSQ